MPAAASTPASVFERLDQQHADVLVQLAELEARVAAAIAEFAPGERETDQRS